MLCIQYIVIKTKKNGKKYVGITQQKLYRRWQGGYGYVGNPYFYKAIKKYGWNNFEHIILFSNLTKEEAEKIEIDLIKKWNLTNRDLGYNIANGGNCAGTLSEETKKKISEAHKGTKLSESTKEKIRAKNKGRTSPNKGKKMSEEFCKKVSNSLKGRIPHNKGKKMSELAREHMRQAQIGHKHTEETKKKMSKSHKGKKLSDETKRKMSEFAKSRGMSEITKQKFAEANERRKIAVVCIATGIEYESASEAGRQTGICKSNILQHCNKKTKKQKWKFASNS